MKKHFLIFAAFVLSTGLAFGGEIAAIILFDTSRSIDPFSFEEGKRISEAIINSLDASDEVALISFDDKPSAVVSLGSGRAAVLEGIQGLELKGNYTAFYDALFDASETLSKSKKDERVVFTLTDGRDENSALLFEDAAAKVQLDNVIVVSMSIGRIPVSQPLRRLSKLTEGIYVPSPQVSNIPELIQNVREATLKKAEAARKALAEAKTDVVKSEPAPMSAPVPVQVKKSSNFLTYISLFLIVVVLFLIIMLLRRKPVAVEPLIAPGDIVPSSAGSLEERLEKTFVERRPSDDQLDKTFVLAEKAYLERDEGKGRKTEYPLQILGSTYIGRSDVNEIKLNEDSVSSQHCRIDHRNDRFRIYDLGSTNGTILNGVKVERSDLKDGDIIQLGKIGFRFKVERSI